MMRNANIEDEKAREIRQKNKESVTEKEDKEENR